MRITRVVLILSFPGLVLGCEPDPAGPETDALEMAPTQTLYAPMSALASSNNGAVIHKEMIGCALPDGEGNTYPPDYSLPCKLEVATFGNNLNAIVVVEADGVPNPTGKTVHWGPYDPGHGWVSSYPELGGPPYPCFLLGTDYDLNNPLFTIHWHSLVTPSGHGKLVCQYQKKWEFQWPN